MKTYFHYGRIGITALAATLLAGCTMVLPTTTTVSASKWASYDDAKKAFDLTVLDKSTDKDLAYLGFTPEGSPNVEILNYVDVVRLFGPAFKLADLPEGVRQCFDARDNCKAYVIKVQNVKNKRMGNVPADLFGFRKYIHTSGWTFEATFVLVNGKLVYKLWNGTPSIAADEHQTTPLGPLQNLSGVVPKSF